MSTTPLRAAMVPVTRQMRAYFAPVNRTTETPTIFDPGLCGVFALNSPPAPWLDLGWVENFARWYDTPTGVVRSGAKALPAAQFRSALEARVEFDFRQWGKLQMALAGGSEHMNVLAPAAGSVTPAPSGGTPAAGVAVLAGSTASQLVFGTGVGSVFSAGCLIAVDVDYQQQIGYVGSGIAAAYVSSAAAVNQDANYVRRVTFNVGRVAEVTATSVVLAQPLLGGVPAAGASAQVVIAFVDREGGSFFQEWSALFVAEQESGGRVCFYYPRLSPNPGGAGNSAGKFVREDLAAIAKPLSAVSLRASFLALPFTDTNDGQTVLCYRSYFPAGMAATY
ncbi:MAG TPA: hypothetical protein VKF84_16500 [Candidatus Sulfotelmatobacter sp.]|nr:hypothetical protein [Candidatus Sulfotelmatobacter sp.]